MKDFGEAKGDLGESGGAPLQVKRGRGSFRKSRNLSYQERTGEIVSHFNEDYIISTL